MSPLPQSDALTQPDAATRAAAGPQSAAAAQPQAATQPPTRGAKKKPRGSLRALIDAGICLYVAVILFRTFDIWKPPPIRRIEQLHAGTGIVLDDAMAGVYGAAILYVLGRLNFY